MNKLSVICGPSGFIPTDDVGSAFLHKHAGKTMTASFKVQRSPEHNRLFWAMANKTYDNLPEPYDQAWPSSYEMVKALELAFGFADQIKVPTLNGWEIVQQPVSLDFANMDQERFNYVSERLFAGMARLLDITVDELLNETRAA